MNKYVYIVEFAIVKDNYDARMFELASLLIKFTHDIIPRVRASQNSKLNIHFKYMM